MAKEIMGSIFESMSSETPTVFQPVPLDWQEYMQSLRSLLRAVLSRELTHKELTCSPDDFELLQIVVDAQVLEYADEWRAMGVAFGDALIALIPGLAWVLVTDDFGTSVVLRYLDSSLHISAITMLLHRVEDGEAVDIQDTAVWIEQFITDRSSDID